MSFDLPQLRAALAEHTRVARVVVAEVAGSTPREVGAAMLVWPGGQIGTIGGGELEWRAARDARDALTGAQSPRLTRMPLGPALGQCCGGAVTLLTECFSAEDLSKIEGQPLFARPITGAQDAPLPVARLLSDARAKGTVPQPQLLQGWMIEPLSQPATPLWIYGAGHVGRALVDVIAPLPDMALTWVDTGLDRFPNHTPANVTCLPAANPAQATRLAPANAHHLILTYSHALDLELCHALLSRDFASVGLIGSATKWARFRARLGALGHPADRIDQITCPIGAPALGKHPQAIAVGVASAMLNAMIENKNHNGGTSIDRGYAPAKRAADT